VDFSLAPGSGIPGYAAVYYVDIGLPVHEGVRQGRWSYRDYDKIVILRDADERRTSREREENQRKKEEKTRRF
jgi:hypothetical protein